jgi:hypothetical protein
MIADINFKFAGFIFSRIIILQKVYKALNRQEILSQLENKIKIWNYKVLSRPETLPKLESKIKVWNYKRKKYKI